MLVKKHGFNTYKAIQQQFLESLRAVSRCSIKKQRQKFRKTQEKKLVPESPFNKLSGLQGETLLKKKLRHKWFLWDLQNTSRYLQLSLVLRQAITSHEVNYSFVFTFFTQMCLNRISQGILTAFLFWLVRLWQNEKYREKNFFQTLANN